MAQMPPMEDKDFEAKGGKYFDAGVHKIFINKAERGTSQSGSEYIEFEVNDESAERSGNVRLYLTEKAAPYTRNTLARIAVHNRETEAQKQNVRDAFKKITDTDKFDAKFLAMFENMQAWILVEEDMNAPKPNGGYYLRYNLFGYEPTPKKTTVEDLIGGAPASKDEQNEIPF